ncbi:ATP-binding cassette domain-containing protein [Nocardia farcinica]|uniref:ATP-binding cassette domain-containing protein n=1 Tax=Nocardia farcinica TaxID=37329 RepID=UPI00189606C7|nr:ATP-binding cassette domain-containing protein [Nocardia farcinica]MBF6362378.1 ATP-binding cassette domain-containing protein [Nocardia farcinica]MBF6386219.1 ATP-binding cassette domain-containing protein [Nocardia farcinica]
MQLLRFLVSISWARIAAVVAAGLVCGAANTYLVTLINGVVSPAPHPRVTLAQFALTGLVVLVSGLLSQVLLIRLAQDAIYRLRTDLSSSVVAAPLEHLERLGTHRLVATLTEDVRALSQAVTAIPAICIDVATIIGCFVYLAMVSGPIFAITIAGTLLGVACVELFLGRVRRIYRDARENEDALLRSFQSVTLGIKELKLHRGRRRDFMDRHLLGAARDLRTQNVDAGSKFSVAQGLGQLLQLATMALILFAVAAAMDLPREVMIGYVLVTTFLAMPMQNFMHRIPDLLRGDVALAKIRAMNLSLETMHDEEQLPYAQRPAVESARLELAGVEYSYRQDAPPQFPPGPPGPHPGGRPPLPPPGAGGLPPQGPPDVNGHRTVSHAGADGRPVPLGPPPPGAEDESGFRLGPVDLVFEPGQITFVVGGNGSGKSTLAKLITGLYVPRAGTVRLNGEPIDHQNIEWFRQHTSAVFTDFHLFEEYLGFDGPGVDDEVRRYLRELRLDDKVTVRDGKLSTVALSQGQRKRLALLTALLEDRPIYVFDEWAADQEPKFREVFYREILDGLKRRGKTVIVITHDDRYFDRADRLVKLDFGRVVDPVTVPG